MNDRLLNKINETVAEYAHMTNMSGRISRDVYDEYVDYCKRNKLYYCGYITFRRVVMSKYNLDSVQVRLPGNKRVYIFI